MFKLQSPHFVSLISNGFKGGVEIGGHAGLDEIMWPWLGDDVSITWTERKPHQMNSKCLHFVLFSQELVDLTVIILYQILEKMLLVLL